MPFSLQDVQARYSDEADAARRCAGTMSSIVRVETAVRTAGLPVMRP